MATDARDWIEVGPLEQVRAKGKTVVKGRHCPILVAADGDRIFAVDNRCPHMGFPLHRGSLEDGMRHAVGLVIGKAILGALGAGVSVPDLVRDAVTYGVANREDWGTVLTALANVADRLGENERFLALYQGIRRVANDCRGRAPRRAMTPLDGSAADLRTLRRWLRRWTAARHETGAERTLLTAAAAGASPAALAETLLAATTDRPFSGGGHTLDFVNKAVESLDLIGWSHAPAVLPSVIHDLVGARGADENPSWRHPDDLIARLDEVFVVLPALVDQASRREEPFTKHADLAETLLGDDPQTIIDALCGAMKAGARPTDLSRSLALAAATRIARFGTANEASDWDTAHHSFTYCHALHALLRRIETDANAGPIAWEGVRGVFHGAMTVYLNRYLNVPPARLAMDDDRALALLPEDGPSLLHDLLAAFDQQHQVDAAAALAARYLALGLPTAALVSTMGQALLREDAGFHTYQLFEACLKQYEIWGDTRAGHTVLLAFVRFLAAHCPTRRAQYQTASIAMRLHRGGTVYEDDDALAIGSVKT